MKLLIAIPTLTAFYNYPTYFLLAIVALLFILQVIGEVMKPNPVSMDHYEQGKEVFSALPDKITCAPSNFTTWSYREVQILCKSNGIKANQKRAALLERLASI